MRHPSFDGLVSVHYVDYHDRFVERSVSGAAVLDKAVAVLDALADGPLPLAELSRRTGIARPTAHRLCASLEFHGLIARDQEDRRMLGSRLQQWADAAPSFEQHLAEVSEPALRRLRDETDESAQLYVIDGNHRRCLVSLESSQGLRTIVEVGQQLPLHLGSAGKALLQGADGWVQSVEEREPGVASVSAAVIVEAEVIAAVSISGPIGRLTRSPGKKYGPAVTKAARSIERALR